MITVTMYVTTHCPACDQARRDLATLQTVVPHRLVEINIDSDDTLKQAIPGPLPVVQVGPYRLTAPFGRIDLQAALSAAESRSQTLEVVEDEHYQQRVDRGLTVSRMDRLIYWLTSHYMLVINLALFLYVGLPFLAPAFMQMGWKGAADVVYTMYKPLCHQLAYRSFFLYGEQPYYPSQLAGIPDIKTYEQLVDPHEYEFFAARKFTGNEQLGYKIALCERDLALWGSLFLFGVVFVLTGRRFKSYSLLWWMVIALVPIGLDGGTQYLSAFQWIANHFGIRESTPLLRVLTGAVFGISTGWYLFPLIHESMMEMRDILTRKFAVIAQQGGKD